MEANELRKELKVGSYFGYTVYENGDIFNSYGEKIKSKQNDKGYPCVTLWINNKTAFRRVHRIVAETFINNPLNKPCVNHIDRDRSNPRVDNLEWVTHSENVIHSVKNGGRVGYTRNNKGEKNPRAKLTERKINAIRILRKHGYSQNELSEIFNMCQGRITKIVNYKVWNHVTGTELQFKPIK